MTGVYKSNDNMMVDAMESFDKVNSSELKNRNLFLEYMKTNILGN